MNRRELLLAELASEILRRGARRIAIDGVDGAGKTTFADELAVSIGGDASRFSADDHLNPPDLRHARGKDDPEGFWLDSYDHSSLRTAVEDAALPVIVDGLFLHRDELVDLWDFSIWLDVPFEVSVPRLAARDGSSPDPEAPSQRRYVAGNQIYMETCQPWQRATMVIENADFEAPLIVTV